MSDPKMPLVRPADFGLLQHQSQLFSAVVLGTHTKDTIQDPSIWANVAGRLKPGDEVRVLADDFSFRANLLVTFAQGTVAKLRLVDWKQIERVEQEVAGVMAGYEIRMRGPKKWCVVKQDSGEVIKEMIPTQAEAIRELSEFAKVLAQ